MPCHNPKEFDFSLHCRENLKSQIPRLYLFILRERILEVFALDVGLPSPRFTCTRCGEHNQRPYYFP